MNKWTRRLDLSRASAGPAGSAGFGHHYFAFLSYSHEDSAEADWLHDELEKFRVPSTLAGKLTANGVIPKRLTPIFRDRHELAAGHDLTEEIKVALSAARCLIVLCSPNAAKSKWTNAEIDQFKRLHPDGSIIAAVVAGEPLASDIPGREDEECFPPALVAKYNRRGVPTGQKTEPLAADLREGKGGRRTGFLKIVAGMLGVGLDELVQRDHIRRQRRLAIISTGSIAGMIIASFLAVAAIEARDAARDQRRQAESLVEFMLGDLKDKLEPIGRLDILDSVGAKALAYYQKQDPSQMSNDALLQRSKALRLMGQVASSRGDLDGALGFYTAAFDGTRAALERSPDDPETIYEHAQDVFYVGYIAHDRGELQKAETAMREYKRLAKELIAKDPTNATWQMEGIYADTNIGVMLNEEGRFADAAAVFENSMVDRDKLAADDPSNPKYKKALLEGLAWLAQAREDEGRFQDALAARQRQIQLLTPLIADSAADAEYQRQAAVAYTAAGRITNYLGDSAKGLSLLRQALQITDRLTATEPTNTTTMARSAWANLESGRVQLSTGALAEAQESLRRGCDIIDRLVAKDPTVVEWRLDLRSLCVELKARSALARGDMGDASQQANALLAISADEIRKADSAKARIVRATGFMLQGLTARSEGRRDEARAAFDRAQQVWPRSAPDRPQNLARESIILKGVGRDAESTALSSRLEQMGYRDRLYRGDLQRIS